MVALLDKSPLPSKTALRARGATLRHVAPGKSRPNSSNCTEFRRFTYDTCRRLESCSKDPIGYEGSEWNLFEYVRSRSLISVDPLGLQTGMIGTNLYTTGESFGNSTSVNDDPNSPQIPGVPPDYPRNPDGTPDIPINPDHPDYPIIWPDDRGPGVSADPPPGLPEKGPKRGKGDGGGCTCNFPVLFHRQRPKGEDGIYPVPGQSNVKCTPGATRVVVYAGTCSNGPCCSKKSCGEVTFYKCSMDGKSWGNGGGNYTYGCQ